jgi:rhodanese-related sulfurtransferase
MAIDPIGTAPAELKRRGRHPQTERLTDHGIHPRSLNAMNMSWIRNARAAVLIAAVATATTARAADATPAAAAPAQALPAACGKPPTAEQRAATKHKAPDLTRAQVDALLADPEHVVFIDLRRPDEISICGGVAVYLSIQSGELESRLAFIPRDRKIATVSNHAARAYRAADLLLEKGFNVVGAVSAEDYAAAGGTLVRPRPPAPRANGEGTAAQPLAAADAAPRQTAQVAKP